MVRQKKLTLHIGRSPEFRRVAILSAFCALGLFLGYLTAGHTSSRSALQLKDYLTTYISLQRTSVDGITFLRSFVVYFRYVLCIFLLSFTAGGLYLIPLVFAVQGFSLAFAVVSFSCCTAASPLALLSLFALRCVIVLPGTLYFGSVAVQAAAGKENRRNCGFWRRCGICFCVLLLGAVLETTIVPRLFALAFRL